MTCRTFAASETAKEKKALSLYCSYRSELSDLKDNRLLRDDRP